MGELEGHDPTRMRISDADRHKVAEVLREAAGQGRLDLDELDERLEATFNAKTYADLVPITVDLHPAPAAPPAAQQVSPYAAGIPGSAPRHTTSLAIMGGQDRKGIWEVGATHNAFALMGGIDIDLRQAIFTTREVVINASTVMGGIDIIVNAFTRVSVEGVGIMGAFDEGRAKIEPAFGPESPLVRVRGIALMGAVTRSASRCPARARSADSGCPAPGRTASCTGARTPTDPPEDLRAGQCCRAIRVTRSGAGRRRRGLATVDPARRWPGRR